MADSTSHHDPHGQSVASWTSVIVLMVAAAVMSMAVVWGNTGIFIAGAVLALVGVIAGKVLAMAGFGLQKPGRGQADSGIG
jgi:Gpi18-like mannosyltransferase